MAGEEISADEKGKEIFAAGAKSLLSGKRLPSATYRLQFNHQFKFSHAKEIVSYLRDLGVSDIYASPYFLAKKGSLHGYDILDQNRLNPEIGTEAEYEELTREIQKCGLGQVLDIVPNHMSIAGEGNSWWMDVLENGPGSTYAGFFDIDWKPVKEELENKVLLPILGDQYGQVLEDQGLVLKFEAGRFSVCVYGEQNLPLDPVSYNRILKHRLEDLEKDLGKENADLQELLSIITAVDHLPPQTEKDPGKIEERRREKEVIKKRILALYERSEPIRAFLDENLRIFNGEKGKSPTFNLLDDLLKVQAYRLAYWRVATEEINYRRFFDINELAAIRMELLPVFREAHKLIFKLLREGKLTGLRVDHPDGLYNPSEYFFRLQKGCFTQICLRAAEREKGEAGQGPPAPDDEALHDALGALYEEEIRKNPSSPLRVPFYIVGEKILTKSERMPEDWPISGTTGYSFLGLVTRVLVDPQNAKAFDALYSRFISDRMNFADLVYEKKKLIMQASLSGEVNTLGHILNDLSETSRHTRDFTLNSLRTAIIEVIACFPVYRSYVNSCGVVERDRRYIEQAVSGAKRKNPSMSPTVFDYLKGILLLKFPENLSDEDKQEWLDFGMKLQQVTGPVMAKGLEDTVFYVYNRLASLNDVGGDPENFGIPVSAFHRENLDRAKSWPYGMIATSTHDAKRGEDVRARIDVLSEIPDEWRKALMRWARINRNKKTLVEGQWVPDRNEEYLLYQTLLGTWPLDREDGGGDEFKKRIQDYMVKAVREAKVNSSWISPNGPYEEALLKFVEALLSAPGAVFRNDFRPLQQKVSCWGMYNSLSQALLKITSPGVPDFYQGTEIWDLNLVDPDNRRPVDFNLRREMLGQLKTESKDSREDGGNGFIRGLLRNWTDGRVKLYLISRSLNYRRENQELFLDGVYIPLTSGGTRKENVVAFARQKGGRTVLTAVPRFLSRIIPNPEDQPVGDVWKETWLDLPGDIPETKFRSVLTGETVTAAEYESKRVLPLDRLFAVFPAALAEGVK